MSLLRVVMCVCVNQNMVSAGAMRPGDVVTASNGKTIEIINTDAGGWVLSRQSSVASVPVYAVLTLCVC